MALFFLENPPQQVGLERLTARTLQLKAQDAAISKLKEMLAQADERFDHAQAEAAQKLYAVQVCAGADGCGGAPRVVEVGELERACA